MTTRRRMQFAWKTAEAFVAAMQRDDPETWATLRVSEPPRLRDLSVLWWDDRHPLVEVPLDDLETYGPSGYLVVSTSRDLPPIFEYATEGDPLSAQVDRLVQAGTADSVFVGGVQRIDYFSAFEVMPRVRVHKKHGGGVVRLSIPDMNAWVLDPKKRWSRSPRKNFSRSDLKHGWDVIGEGAGLSPTAGTRIVNKHARPIRYNQNYSTYTGSPRRIAGCVPVAYTMVLSGWKRWKQRGAHQKIWRNNRCWTRAWSSGMTPNPSQCRAVEKTIWRVHTLCKTAPNGDTHSNHIFKGLEIFDEMGLEWEWKTVSHPTFQLAFQIAYSGQPFFLAGVGTFTGKRRFADVADKEATGRKVGHAVAVYGVNAVNRTIKATMGWGSNVPDRWLTFSQLKQTRATYLLRP